jgi:hypothetical protein
VAWIFGRPRVNNPDPVAVGLRVQSSMQGVPIPIGCGRTRWSGNLIDYAGFVATPAKSPGSKGGLAGASGKGNTGQYNYSVSGLISVGEGGIKSFNRIFNGTYINFLTAPTTQELIDLNNMGINSSDLTYGNSTYNAIFHYGNWTDGPDSWWTSQYPAQTAIAYPGQAYVIFPNLGLGSSPSFPSFSVDATWNLSGDIPSVGDDANPADWIEAFLTNSDWGVQGFPSSAIGDFATAKNYWRATGLLISLTLTSQTAAQSHLKSLIDSLNADFRWSDGQLDIVPYGDVAVTGNGYTYTPSTTPIYNLGVNDFLPNQGTLGQASTSEKVKVAHSRADASQIPNIFQMEYLDRANLYNPVEIYQSNDANITASGKSRYGDKKSQHWFCLASAASLSCALQLHRAWTTLNTYQFTVGKQFMLLDVLDLVTLTEPALQLSNQLVRITEIQENQDGSLTMTAEEVPLTASAPVYARQQSIGIARNTAIPPGSINAPVIMELPGQLSQALQVQFAVSGQNPANWGGCTVWISTDGTNYDQLGTITTAARMGVLTATLASVSTSPSGPTLDTTNTLAVNLTESQGILYSGTSADLAALSTLCLVDGELIAYQNASLTSSYHYSLTTLERGCYGTQGSVQSHAVGASFVRLDDAIYRWTYTDALIGKTVYFKFTSFNAYGTNEENLADVTAYSHVLSGTPTPSGISISTATLTQVGVANTLSLTWAADPLAVSYIVDYSTDGGSTYTAVAVPNVTSWQIPGLQVSEVFVRVAGVSANDVQGPYLSPVDVVGPPLNYASGVGLSYNDLTSSAMAQALDDIRNEEAAIIGAAQAALSGALNLATVARNANANTTVQAQTIKAQLDDDVASLTQTIEVQASEQQTLSAQILSLTASLDDNVATINSTLVTQATAQSATAAGLTTLAATVDDPTTGLAATHSTLTNLITTQSFPNSTYAGEITTLQSKVDDSVSGNAALHTSLLTQADDLTTLASSVTTVSAVANGISASGQIAFVATTGPTGSLAAWSLEVTATGHATSSASMTVSANSDGTSSFFFKANEFAIGDPTTHTVPFQTLSGGGLKLTGVTQIDGSIVSEGVGADSVPYLTLNFGSAPYLQIDDGT